MEKKITLEQVCEIWRQVQRPQSPHVATSVLFDLATQQELSSREKTLAFEHLRECPACVEELKYMFGGTGQQEAAPSPVTVIEDLALAAAGPRLDAQELLITEDKAHQVRFIVRPGEPTILQLEVKPGYGQELEGKYVRVLDANEREIGQGQIVLGTVSWAVAEQMAHPLRLTLADTP